MRAFLILLVLASGCRLNDFDEDGYGPSDDCDNFDPNSFPGAEEVCDAKDNDCDGAIDEDLSTTFYVDDDGDGFGVDANTTEECRPGPGLAAESGDCDDSNPFAFPGAPELCDGVDNDCNDSIDDGVEYATFYLDDDGDGYGDASEAVDSCLPIADHVLNGDDCNDDDPNEHPGADEVCGGPDRNCDGDAPDLCRTCLDLLENGGPTAGDGEYMVDMDTAWGPLPPSTVYCDMTTDGGGWTLVQRTVWDWSDTQALYTDYTAWHDTTLGDPTPGNAYRLAGKAWPYPNHQGEHLFVNYLRTTTGGACSPLHYKAEGGTLDVGAAAATLTAVSSSISSIVGTELSAVGSGPTACGTDNDGVPWFYASCCRTCPSFMGAYWSDEPHPMANYTSLDDMFGLARSDVCSGQTALQSENASPFYGIDTMEYYLR